MDSLTNLGDDTHPQSQESVFRHAPRPWLRAVCAGGRHVMLQEREVKKTAPSSHDTDPYKIEV